MVILAMVYDVGKENAYIWIIFEYVLSIESHYL